MQAKPLRELQQASGQFALGANAKRSPLVFCKLFARQVAFSEQPRELLFDPTALLLCKRGGFALRSPPWNGDANGAVAAHPDHVSPRAGMTNELGDHRALEIP